MGKLCRCNPCGARRTGPAGGPGAGGWVQYISLNLNRPTHPSWLMHTLGHARIMPTARFAPPDSMESPEWTIYESSCITNRVCIGFSDAQLQLNSTCGSSLKHAPLLYN